MARTEVKSIGSIWVECDEKGEAACPHCKQKGWFRGVQWAGCKHAVGPGTVQTNPALIFKGES